MQHWILNLASLFLAFLIGGEILMVHQLDHVTTMVEKAQAPLVQAQQKGPQIHALIERTAVGATRDPALKDLLLKYGIAVTPAKDAATSVDSTNVPAPATP